MYKTNNVTPHWNQIQACWVYVIVANSEAKALRKEVIQDMRNRTALAWFAMRVRAP